MNIGELNLLVVEDDVFQRQMIVQMLRSIGTVAIIEASDGNQALAVLHAAESKSVDIVICDLNMPEMDGLEFLRHLSSESHQPEVVIVSGLDDKLLSSATRMAKMYGIRLLGTMQKPGTLVQLKDLLSKHIRVGKKLQPPEAAKTFAMEEILHGLRANQFEPFFQPKVDLKSGRLVGAEGLARWVHPEFGVVGPYAFIELMEQNGHIDELTFLILKKSAEACSEFHKNGHILTISVNLSLSSLDDVTLANKIINTVRQAGVDPHYIVLEITETTAMTESGHALENLTRLCMHGFVLSIDDYGTGYSSMQQLTRIAFGELKIDQSFVKDCAQNPSLHIVVKSSIDMAHRLHVKSVAEGVESQQDWDMLQSMGCDTAQGYFISKPLAKSAFADFMLNYIQPTQIPAKPGAKGQESMRILVVEDDKFVRGIIVRVLNDLRFTQIMDVDSAVDARILLEKHTFDLIVTDVEMPGMNGLELIQLIRTGKTHAKADTRILVLTGYSNSQMMSVALALDVNGFLIKPVVAAVLYEKIAKAMTEKMHLRSPLAYQSVVTKLQNLPNAEASKEAAIVSMDTSPAAQSSVKVSRLTLRELRPNMIVRENIFAKDGTLLISAGRVLTEVSIHRMNDLSGILKSNIFMVEEEPKTA
jgi:EAL domain-containing protein (putative c-di-GMP-specific phosphodiesterase class I)/DNA-binding NarL/FixJ family response regulator